MSESSPEIRKADTKEIHGVLLSDEIKRCVDDFQLIHPFQQNNLQAASYDFTIGRKYKREGEEHPLDDDHPNLTIRPHEAVFVCTNEELNMPRFLVGRWNLKVKRVWEGLVWVGGVHIDPGWQGPLWCPIYNLSKDPVTLHPGDTFASIEFETTTLFNKDCIEYKKTQKDLKHPGSGLEELRDEVTKFPKSLEKYQANVSTRLEQYQGANFFIMSIIIGAMAIIVLLPFGGPNGIRIPTPLPEILFLITIFSALVLSVISTVLHVKNWRKK